MRGYPQSSSSFSDDVTVRCVLVNNNATLTDSPWSPLEVIEVPVVTVPIPPSQSLDPHQLDDKTDPVLKDLDMYEQ